MGIPVPHGVADESAEIVEREGVELVFEPEDAEALREGLLRLERDHSLYERLKARGIPTSLASITELSARPEFQTGIARFRTPNPALASWRIHPW